MAQTQKKQIAGSVVNNTAVVVGTVIEHGKRWRWVLAAMIVGLAIGVASATFYLTTKPDAAPAGPKYKTLESNPELLIPTNYRKLGEQATQAKLKKDLGVDITPLKSRPITSNDFRTFEQAYIVAQAYLGLDDLDRSLQTYAAAEKLAKGTDANYGFYNNYASVYKLKSGVGEGYVQLLQKAKTALLADTNWTKEDKNSELQNLNYQIDPKNNPVPSN